jgi:hypothetical protein
MGLDMKREDKYLSSHAPYAVDPESFSVVEKWATYTNPDGSSRRGETPHYSMTIGAVWFRRKAGVLTAHLGTLWDSELARPADWLSWLESFTDGRYGGRCETRYDGNNLWSPETDWPEMQERQVFLQEMLDDFPQIPARHVGWWTFRA